MKTCDYCGLVYEEPLKVGGRSFCDGACFRGFIQYVKRLNELVELGLLAGNGHRIKDLKEKSQGG